ncbi:DMT family transporter [Amycolatopsis acidicola]|uniref:DMT family transporter n=1 Tax=Amycolatopsis acidicola TaxID=2596893 RepID=UPI00140D9969|nr:DMT family transporter [Amycolatopsis acidicola]
MAGEWTSLAIAVPAAVVGAALMGLASAAQAKATKQVPQGKTLHPGLLVDLAHRPLWLVGIGATIAGLLLQVLALGFGPLMLVQPLLVTALPFAGMFAAWLSRRRADRVVVLGTLICVAGLAGFLALAQPTGGSNDLVGDVGPLAVILGLVALAGLGLSTVLRGGGRVLGLALATGVFYGVTAALMKVVAGQLREGAGVPFTHWALYVVCVVGPIGFLLSQNTFQQGRMISPALAVITTIDPLIGVAIGIGWMGESASTGTAVLAGEIAAAAVIVAGIAVLAHRSSHLVAPASPAAGSPEPRSPHVLSG